MPTRPPKLPEIGIDALLQRGLRLHRAGRTAEAATLYMRVLAREASQPAANHLLGLVRLGEGRAEEAVRLIARAVAGNGREPQYLANLGVALNAAGRPAEAVAALDRAIRLKPDFAEAHANRGMALRNLHRLDDAVASQRRAISLKPAEAGFHFNLGNVLADQGDPLAAEAAYREALRLRPNYPAAIAALAEVLGRSARTSQAVTLVADALQRMPADPRLHYWLGRGLQAEGRTEAAATSYRRAVELQPAYGEAYYYLSHIVRHRVQDAEVVAMARLFEDQSAPVAERAFAGFGLGKALTDLGEHDQAIAAYLEANRLHRSQSPYAVEPVLKALAADTAGWTGQGEGGDRSAAPIFVVGPPRSGKTTIESILARHPAVRGVGELPTMTRLGGNFRRQHPDPSAAPPEVFRELGAAYLAEVAKLIPPGTRSVDTMPPNFRQLGLIRRALPRARIIHCVRESASHRIALFEKQLSGGGYEYASAIPDLVAYHRAYRAQMAEWHGLLGDELLDVDVADFAADPEGFARRILMFCGLDWDSACALPLNSEPQLDDWPADVASGNRMAHLTAWRAAKPGIWAE